MGRFRRTWRARRSVRCTAWNRPGATAFRVPAGTSPAARRYRYRPASESAHMRPSPSLRSPQGRSSIVLLSELSRFPGTYVFRQLVVKVDGAAFPVRVGLGATEAGGLHSLLHRGHVREVLRQDGQPVG